MSAKPAATELDPRAIETRQHIVDAAIAESLDPPLAERFRASLARAAAARARLRDGTIPPSGAPNERP